MQNIPNIDNKRYSIGTAAEYLGVSIDTLRRWEKRGRIVALRSPGGHRYFLKRDLDDLFGLKYTRDEETYKDDSELKDDDITTATPDDQNEIPSIEPRETTHIKPSAPSYVNPIQQYSHDIPAPPPIRKNTQTNSQPELQKTNDYDTENKPTENVEATEAENNKSEPVDTNEIPSPPNIPQEADQDNLKYKEDNLTERQKVLLDTILKSEKKPRKVSSNKIFKYIVIAVIILAIVNIAILYFWKFSPEMVSPIP